MALRWAAATVLETEKSFCKIMGYRDWGMLEVALDQKAVSVLLALAGRRASDETALRQYAENDRLPLPDGWRIRRESKRALSSHLGRTSVSGEAGWGWQYRRSDSAERPKRAAMPPREAVVI
jgi:hypothetical protein